MCNHLHVANAALRVTTRPLPTHDLLRCPMHAHPAKDDDGGSTEPRDCIVFICEDWRMPRPGGLVASCLLLPQYSDLRPPDLRPMR